MAPPKKKRHAAEVHWWNLPLKLEKFNRNEKIW